MAPEVRRNGSREPQICGTTWATDACSRRGGSEQAASARGKGENMGVSRCQTGLL